MALYSINEAGKIYSRVTASVEDLNSKIFTPILRSEIGNVGSRYTCKDLYSVNRELVQKEFEKGLRKLISSKGIIIDRFLIRFVRLPAEADKAIQNKITA